MIGWLIGRKLNHQKKSVCILGRGKLDSIRLMEFGKKVSKYLFWRTYNPIELNLRILSNLNLYMVHVAAAGYANLCRVVGWVGGKKPSQEAGPLEQPQRSLRSPCTVQYTGTVHRLRRLKIIKAAAHPVTRCAAPPKIHKQPPHHDFPHTFDICIAVAPVSASGLAEHFGR